MKGLPHLDLNVSDVSRSASFYDRILTHIGFTRVVDSSDEEAGSDWIAPEGTGYAAYLWGLFPQKAEANLTTALRPVCIT